MSDELRSKIQSRGFQPARGDLEALFLQLGGPDRDEAEVAERALARLRQVAADAAIERFPAARAPLRHRLVGLIGRVALESRAQPLREFLSARLDDEDPKSRRNAVIALGKLGGPTVEPALIARFAAAPVELQRSIAAALGKLGGPDSLALLRTVRSSDAELTRIAGEALVKLERTLGRAEAAGAIDADATPPKPLPVILRCREGLTHLVVDELGERFSPRAAGDEAVAATLSGPLSSLFVSRCALSFAFPLAFPPTKDPGDAVIAALTSDAALAIFRAFTKGPIRYRIEWSTGGHRRGLTFRVAAAIRAARPELVNDPTASLWQAVVREVGGISIELEPRGLVDPRFAWRVAHVPASSHPTLAAAIARIGGARPDDVVWDPFVGAGAELVERARLGPYASLLGTDVDGLALDLARRNLTAAGLAAVPLERGDARSFRPPAPPTLILTNPPMGRRVLSKELTGALYDAFLDHAAEVLAPGGRLVWISPRARDTAERAERLGLAVTYRQRIDMAGFWAELQRFEKISGGAARGTGRAAPPRAARSPARGASPPASRPPRGRPPRTRS